MSLKIALTNSNSPNFSSCLDNRKITSVYSVKSRPISSRKSNRLEIEKDLKKKQREQRDAKDLKHKRFVIVCRRILIVSQE